MPGPTIRIAKIAGIPVGISPWWIVIVALLTWSLGVDVFGAGAAHLGRPAAMALALASVLTVFAGILAHELAHALVARRYGVEIEEVDLWLLGGVARMRNQPRHALDELRFAVAGPAATALLALAFGAVSLALSPGAPAALRAFVDYQVSINALIAVFNLLPALPLDGGRAARAVLWLRSGDLRAATVVTAMGGRGLGYAMIGLGVVGALAGYGAGLWSTLVGIFLVVAAAGERHRVELADALEGVTVAELMTPHPAIAPGEGEPTVHAGEPAGGLLENPGFQRAGRAVVIDEAGRPIGFVSARDLELHSRPRRLRKVPAGSR
jgi:Zn-dependent protease